jgi:Flp pilus assembly protein TadD
MTAKTGRLLRIASPLLVICVGFALFAGTLKSPITSDDVLVVIETPQIYNIANLPRVFFLDIDRPIPEDFPKLQDQPSRTGLYRPMLSVSFILDAFFYGDEVFGWRLTSLLLHLIAALLVLGLAQRLLGSRPGALVAALLFVAHPIHTEAVAMLIGGRSELLASIFVLAAWWVFLSADERTGWRRWALDSGSALLFLLGLFSKENAVVLPGILFLSGWLLRAQSAKQLFIRLSPFAAVFSLYVIMRLFVIGKIAPIGWFFAFGDLSAVQIFLAMMTIMIRYLGMVLVPFPLQHQACYTNLPSAVSGPVGWICTLMFLGMIGWSIARAMRGRRCGRPAFWAFGLIVFYLCLIPVSHLVPFWVLMAERFLYLPSVAFCLVAGHLAVRAYAVRRWIPVVAVAAVLAAYAPMTVQRNADWADLDRLWGQVAECDPDSPAPYGLMGSARMRAGRPADAIEYFKKAAILAPRDPSPRYNLGLACQRLGKIRDAEGFYRQVLTLEPKHSQALNNLGILLQTRSDPASAREAFEKAVQADPSHPAPFINLGNLLQHEGKFDQAEKLFRMAGRMAPNLPEPRFNLARLLEQTGRSQEAERLYRDIIENHPDHALAHNNLANFQKDRQELEAAERHYRVALRADPRCLPAYLNLARLLLQLGRQSEARETAVQAQEISPQDPQVLKLLARIGRATK